MSYRLLVDIETTGLPKAKSFGTYYHPSSIHMYSTSRVVELGFIVFDDNYNIVYKYNSLRKPEDFMFKQVVYEKGPKQGQFINDITYKMCISNGVLWLEMVNLLMKVIDKFAITEFYAFNVLFDYNCLLSEAYRNYNVAFIDVLTKLKPCCIMEYSKVYMKDMNSRKYNAEATYNMLFKTDKKETHRALEDCYIELEILKSLDDKYKKDKEPIILKYID